jgi:DUF1009 family protein
LKDTSQPVGLIAGNLSLPVLAARKIKAEGRPLSVIGFCGETDPELKLLSDHYLEIPLGQLQPLADFFLKHGVKKISMAGGLSRENIINSYLPDEAAIKLMESLSDFQTDNILRAVAGWLEEKGLNLVSVVDLIPEILVKPGLLTKTVPSPELLEDLNMAFRLAKELGRLDVGQTVVVSEKIAVALEGADGTNATIRRGASLCKKPIAVAKVVKPTQDFRLDLPVIGPETIEVLIECQAGGLILDSTGLIMLEQEKCLLLADQATLVILAGNGSNFTGPF